MLKHFIVFSILFIGGVSIPIKYTTESTSSLGWFVLVANFLTQAVIAYYGIWYTYQVNQKGDGRDYFYRFFSLALPISIWLAIIGIATSFAFVFVLTQVDGNGVGHGHGEIIFGILTPITSAIYSTAFYYLLGKYMRVCSNGS